MLHPVPLCRVAVPLLLGALVGCRSEPGPEWLHLARVEGTTTRVAQEGGTGLRMIRDESGSWYEIAVTGESWRESRLPECWIADLPCRGVTISGYGDAHRVTGADGRIFTSRTDQVNQTVIEGSGDWSFVRGGKVVVHLAESGARPPACTVWLQALHVDDEAGVTGRVRGARFSGEGFSVLPGSRREVSVDLSPGAVLHFGTCAERVLLKPGEGEDRVTFRVALDGRTLLRHEQDIGVHGSLRWHRLVLPVDGARRAKLVFEVDGVQALTSFLAPRIGPAEIGEYGRRPWGEERENIVVFLADTFRADNLAAYGGDPALTPHLNAFAAESRCYERVWSTSTSTLPAHISMFTGLYPRESGADNLTRALPEVFDTIAERLARYGYRTAAITDSVVVSRTYGLDQGFEHFDELRQGFESTLERTRDFLASDDGRPVFLFVHTYRAHAPYRVTEETKQRLAAEMGFEFPEEWSALNKRFRLLSPEEMRGPPGAEIASRLLTLYRGASADLDRGFGDLRRMLGEYGLEERGTILVTSDHGEAFHEHGPEDHAHSGHVWEEQVRVPLLVHSRRIAPGRNAFPISLVDLAPTLAEIARIPADDRWRGRSILGLAEVRPIYAFQCGPPGDGPPTVAIVEGDHKLILYEDARSARLSPGDPLGAFDLGRDPGEEVDLHSAGEAWPAELLRRLGPTAEGHLVPLEAPQAAVIDADHAAELDALGYGGRQK